MMLRVLLFAAVVLAYRGTVAAWRMTTGPLAPRGDGDRISLLLATHLALGLTLYLLSSNLLHAARGPAPEPMPRCAPHGPYRTPCVVPHGPAFERLWDSLHPPTTEVPMPKAPAESPRPYEPQAGDAVGHPQGVRFTDNNTSTTHILVTSGTALGWLVALDPHSTWRCARKATPADLRAIKDTGAWLPTVLDPDAANAPVAQPEAPGQVGTQGEG